MDLMFRQTSITRNNRLQLAIEESPECLTLMVKHGLGVKFSEGMENASQKWTIMTNWLPLTTVIT